MTEARQSDSPGSHRHSGSLKNPPAPPPFGKIAVFHFISPQLNPVDALVACLADLGDAADLSDCLIVTPEAFNIRGGYWGNKRELDHSVLSALSRLSILHKVAFVSGLIEEDQNGAAGFSSAYLIDGPERWMLSRKAGNDGSGNYTACPDEWDRPIQYRGLRIGALICMDAGDFGSPPKRRHEAILSQLATAGAMGGLLCIPARMQSYASRAVAEAWPSHLTVAVANGDHSQPSVIRRRAIGSDTEPAVHAEGSDALLIRTLI